MTDQDRKIIEARIANLEAAVADLAKENARLRADVEMGNIRVRV